MKHGSKPLNFHLCRSPELCHNRLNSDGSGYTLLNQHLTYFLPPKENYRFSHHQYGKSFLTYYRLGREFSDLLPIVSISVAKIIVEAGLLLRVRFLRGAAENMRLTSGTVPLLKKSPTDNFSEVCNIIMLDDFIVIQLTSQDRRVLRHTLTPQ